MGNKLNAVFKEVDGKSIQDKRSDTRHGGALPPLGQDATPTTADRIESGHPIGQNPISTSLADRVDRDTPLNVLAAGMADTSKARSPVAPSHPIPAVHEGNMSQHSSITGVKDAQDPPMSPAQSAPDAQGTTYACIQYTRGSPTCNGFAGSACASPATTKPMKKTKQHARSPPFPPDLRALFVHPISEHDFSNTDPYLLAALDACRFVSFSDVSAVIRTLTTQSTV